MDGLASPPTPAWPPETLEAFAQTCTSLAAKSGLEALRLALTGGFEDDLPANAPYSTA